MTQDLNQTDTPKMTFQKILGQNYKKHIFKVKFSPNHNIAKQFKLKQKRKDGIQKFGLLAVLWLPKLFSLISN